MKLSVTIPLLFFLFICLNITEAQILGFGYKQDKRPMIQAAVNYPLIIGTEKKYSLLIGADYTTKNPDVPSGLQPQLTASYHLQDSRRKDLFFAAGITTGYLLDFNKSFKNQLRVSPHLYAEYVGVLYLKVGYDHLLPLNKGFPFISIGIGGLYLFRHMSLGL